MKRRRKISTYICLEGNTEERLYNHIRSVYGYNRRRISIEMVSANGGNSDRTLQLALNKQDRKRCLAWFDEDIPLTDEIKRKLAVQWHVDLVDINNFIACPDRDLQRLYNPQGVKKPCLIVSSPVCVEGLILRILEKNLPHEVLDLEQRKEQINDLKATFNAIRMGDSEEGYYAANLIKTKVEELRRDIPELDILINIIVP